ncbi:MAG TPA: flagellar biosynthesis anti-sigma factor FlgM [Phycisphaerales bacterium]|nr:flagellar biosynthesis anti-sigma factor FlgM [Phycisphaerales bacterium]
MMHITASGSSVAAGSAAGSSVRARTETQGAASAPVRRGEDTVEVSSMASLMSKKTDAGERLSGTPIRTGLVDRIRREIAEGTYDVDSKLDAALDRMIDEMM